ncbi:acetyl-CoA carboxylase biotin carboxylase subunit [Leeia aquatica]|uniref:biotin carboxylase n=1 Tax=Leeia aquatica TaxID=2725557 RepID=A0A847S8H4_9NEIS|nr:acetyl-CoA carboxylase biotin carboxylase subunit [Leeia aquatica]NLR75297.1 acetyl-CoA carboxylase biotin carboxylase subunit [Leeia aquatica]
MQKPIKKLLIANRGEIAVRIIRAARELDIRTVVVCSEADIDSQAVRLADEHALIGPAQAAKSYLDKDKVLAVAKEVGADAIHPGYGFLSENASFAEACEQSGIVFVGPSASAIRTMGDKAAARTAAMAAGVPVVPGSDGEVGSLEGAIEAAGVIGYPVMIKAAAGGGGRGIRIAKDEAELCQQYPIAVAEATSAFGNGAVYLERFIASARHIEVQVLGDGTSVIHLFERDCSIQRRRQKIFEEAGSPVLDEATRKALCASAVKLAEAVAYRGAGTLEYLFDSESGEFFFIEMNTRIQVEHPITEMITGVDLLKAMLRIAAGESLPYSQQDITRRGHAIEVRINAEDPEKQFMPCPGLVGDIVWPQGPGVRIDSLLRAYYQIPAYYDSLLAKLIVWDESRPAALARLKRSLGELSIAGVKTTQPLFLALLETDAVKSGEYDTNWLERWMSGKREEQKPAESTAGSAI